MIVLKLLLGGLLGFLAASVFFQLGWRSADRLPGESRLPHCAWCQKPYAWRDMIPLLGWIRRRPRPLALACPCGERTGLWPQPTAEILGFVLGATGMLLTDNLGQIIPLSIGLGLLPAIALVDLHFSIIPDELNLALALSGIWWAGLSPNEFYVTLMVSAALLALGLFCALVYSKWRKQDMLGLGDVKFFAAAGLWLTPMLAPWFLIAAGFLGAGLSFFWRRAGGSKEFPFAPALCLSLAGCILARMIFQA
ncbi:MAG: A24 family peptidase [Bdellovibrionales bacterium]